MPILPRRHEQYLSCPGKRALLIVALCLAALGSAFAQSVPDQPSSDDALSRKATDPTASLMSFQLNDWYTASIHGLDGAANQVVVRAAIPFDIGDRGNIFRVTLPYVTSSPVAGSGLTDTTVFDIAVFNAPWGRWGIGASGSLPTGSNALTQDKWTLGPAAGFVNSSDKRTNWGLFLQTFYSFAGSDQAAAVRLLNLQPIYSYQFGKGRSLSLGNSALVYDSHSGRWASLMVGPNFGWVVGFAGLKWRPNAEVDYDFVNEIGNAGWVFRIGIALLVPTA